jgi:hypothetical protein
LTAKTGTIVLICAGLALLAVSAIWPMLMPRESYWTDADQREFAEALQHAHELEMRSVTGRRASAENPEDLRQAVEASQRHVAAQVEKLESAQSRSQLAPRILFWLGILMIAAGLGVYRIL